MKYLNPLTVGLILALLISWIIGISIWLEKREYKEVLSKPLTDLKKENPEIKRYIDSSGNAHVVFKDRIITRKNDLSGAIPYNKTYADSLAKALNIKASELTESTEIRATLEGKIKAYKVTVDSLKRRQWFFDQKYLTAAFSESDSILRYRYNPKIGIVKSEKKNILGQVIRREIDFTSPDSNLVIDSIRQFRISEPVRRHSWGVGLQAGFYYDPITNTFIKGFGIGISKNLFSF